METGGPVRLLRWAGLADATARLKLPPLMYNVYEYDVSFNYAYVMGRGNMRIVECRVCRYCSVLEKKIHAGIY